MSYFHREFRLAFILQKREEPALVGNIPAHPGSTTISRTQHRWVIGEEKVPTSLALLRIMNLTNDSIMWKYLFEALGVIGGLFLVLALWRVSKKAWPPESTRYHTVNLAGAICIILNAWSHDAYSPLAVNVIWACISARQLWQNLRASKR